MVTHPDSSNAWRCLTATFIRDCDKHCVVLHLQDGLVMRIYTRNFAKIICCTVYVHIRICIFFSSYFNITRPFNQKLCTFVICCSYFYFTSCGSILPFARRFILELIVLKKTYFAPWVTYFTPRTKLMHLTVKNLCKLKSMWPYDLVWNKTRCNRIVAREKTCFYFLAIVTKQVASHWSKSCV